MTKDNALVLSEIRALRQRLEQVFAKQALAEAAAPKFRGHASPNPARLDTSEIAAQLREELRSREARARYFPEVLCDGVAWTILQTVYLSQLQERPISVTGVCDSSHYPPTTALRYLTWMVEHGWLTRFRDEHDKRRSWVGLTYKATVAMFDYAAYRAAGIRIG